MQILLDNLELKEVLDRIKLYVLGICVRNKCGLGDGLPAYQILATLCPQAEYLNL